ncbi:hypothetical protein [Azospirillum sp.]|uniref:hypothetical protein n=1 Tax=Azospirillum sp. TaxID=34012 RepID=UPI003D753F3C
MALIASRFGLAGIVAVALGIWIGALKIEAHSLRSDLADAARRGDVLEAAVKEQNAAVVAMQEKAATDAAERSARALRALAPRQKANPKDAVEMNAWIAQSP